MSFCEELKRFDWGMVARDIIKRTPMDVEKVLGDNKVNLDGLISLLSPAAEAHLEEMAQRAHRLTDRRFGRTIHMFVPIYLSNVCRNRCVYCGFNAGNIVNRMTLTPEQVYEEGLYLHRQGFRHILLVSGEAPDLVDQPYLIEVLECLKSLFSSIAIEIYPMDVDSYRRLVNAGADGLVVFQETYHKGTYAGVHPAGKKRDFKWRLQTAERGGEAGFRRLGLGVLLGLADWRVESFFLGLHASHLLRHFWQSRVSISFPRLRPAAGRYELPFPVSDRNLVQMLTALRLFLPDVDMVLSTRESADFRDHLIPLGITSMSAGSRTDPGGYAQKRNAEAQFAIADERTPEVVAEVIRSKGYEPVWKDWDSAFLHRNPT